MANSPNETRSNSGLRAFVTVGTTRFDKLISSVTSPAALRWFASHGYTQLTIQYGTGEEPVISKSQLKLDVHTYSFRPSLKDDMESADVVISHAGAGTVMEALRLRKKLVVVINTLLMDNHQEELAEAMQERGHLLMVANPELLDMDETWESFDSFQPSVLVGGDVEDFPRLLNSFLGFSSTKDD